MISFVTTVSMFDGGCWTSSTSRRESPRRRSDAVFGAWPASSSLGKPFRSWFMGAWCSAHSATSNGVPVPNVASAAGPGWDADLPQMTRAELQRKRQEFWETRIGGDDRAWKVISLMGMFTVARIVYLLDYRHVLTQAPFGIWELPLTLLSAAR